MLTGLLDERGWDDLLHKELERARRSGNRVGIVVGQIDGDAPLAEHMGERHADELIAEIGGVLGATIRLNDEAARVNGEQFAIVCPYTDERGATIMAERAGSLIRERETDDPHTVSFGIASYPKHGTSADALMQAARHALDEARGLGGDRAVSFYAAGDSIEERLRSDVEIEVVSAEYG
jgi:diguanylate cyclase (GGDEF)-like protein